MEFKDLGLSPSLLKNIRDTGYETPTPIQQATIPLVLEGKDVLGCAQTGTGKTAAFALPILQRLKEIPPQRSNAKVIRCLILSPTRELAMQTWENFQLYGKGEGLDSAVIFGGVGQGGQVEALHRGAEIVIACPGRLLDLMGQGLVRLDWVDIFVLDEADRMLDMGFIHDVRKIVRTLPEERQTLLFSATMPPEVEKLALDLLTDPENVKVDPVTSTVDAIDQCLYYVDKVNKKHLLAQLLEDPEVESALVFSRTKHGVDRIVRDLKRKGIEAAGIHGDKSQNARQTALNLFRSGKCRVLVATDIAARGIDVAGLSHVFNYDMPMEPEAYIKRLALKESDWPMEVTTPTPPKVREPRPARLDRQGNALAERRQAAVAAKPAARPARPASSRPTGKVTIGRDGQIHSRPAARGTGRPVRRVNRQKRRG